MAGRLPGNFAVRLKEENGRVVNGDEDWGAVVAMGEPLACCGCILSHGHRFGTHLTKTCDCRCHASYHQIHRTSM